MKLLTTYNKFFVVVLGVILTGANIQYGSNAIVQMVIALAVAAGVYHAPYQSN